MAGNRHSPEIKEILLMSCEVRRLDTKEIFFVYRRYVANFFEDEFILTEAALSNLLARKIYIGYGLYDNNNLVGFGLFFTNRTGNVMLLDYYVTLKKYRRLGYPSRFWQLLKERLINGYGPELKVKSITAAHKYFIRPENKVDLGNKDNYFGVEGIFIELEGVQDADRKALRERARKLLFYRNIGSYMTDTVPNFMDEEYNVMYFPVFKSPGREELNKMLLSVYMNILPSFKDRKKYIRRLTE